MEIKQAVVSIIVPVYKAEKYIHQCVDSLLAQTYSNIEVILVDDGSPDNCGTICDEYAATDCRVKVIHQQNGGVSVARQTGIMHASGKYSIHADPDDWVEPNMIEELVAKADAENVDMVICDFYRESKSGKTYDSQNPGEECTAYSILKDILYQKLHGSCWNKLVKRNSIEGLDFTPDSLCILEDELYNIRILSRNIKVTYLPKAFYHYRIDNRQSVCYAPSEKSFASKIKAVASIEDFCKKNIKWILPSDFLMIKSNVLYDALLLKQYSYLKNLYPDLREAFIMRGSPYKIKAPVSSCIALALKGYPHIAYMFYHLNMTMIRIGQTVIRILYKFFSNLK